MSDAPRKLALMTVEELLAAGHSLTIADANPTGATIFTTVRGLEILRIEADGRLVRGKDFRTDDEMSVVLFDCLAAAMPCYLAALRQRAEEAERELARLKADGWRSEPGYAPFTGVSG